MKLLRSLLFVPGNNPAWMDKAPKYGADALILDLEDAVPANEKRAARPMVRAATEALGQRGVTVVVRVNAVETGLTGEDVEAVVGPGLFAIMIPKAENAADVRKVDAWIELFERKAGLALGSVAIIVMPETARGVRDAYELATACPRVANMCATLGSRAGDLTRSVGYKWTRAGNETLYMESHILLAARAAGMAYPLAGGPLEFEDLDWVRERVLRARELGYRGTLQIHPSQVPIANDVFSPSREEIAWNVGLLRAFAAAGRGTTRYDGMMIDRAHTRNALALLAQAEAFGLAVGEYPRSSLEPA